MSGKKDPEWRRELGHISCAVFAHENAGENGTVIISRSVHCQRRYYDKNAEAWKWSGYLSHADVGAAISLLTAAHQYLIDVEQSTATDTF